MDRELVLVVLVLSVIGPACFVVGAMTGVQEPLRSGRETERACWRRLWLPLVLAFVVFAALLGWALQEPCDSERPPLAMIAAACLFGAVWTRAIARAIWSLLPLHHIRLGTHGFLRPTIVIDPTLRSELDVAAFDAALAHERAHAKHHDPFRIWCAQFASDLQWPAPNARTRLASWLHALELARDEEAREAGVDGADLAAAILHVAKGSPQRRGAIAMLTGSEALRDRVSRLFAPLRHESPRHPTRRVAFAVWGAAGATSAIAGGTLGEHVVRALTGLQ